MKRTLNAFLLSVLALTLVLFPLALADLPASRPPPVLCRVTAAYQPSVWPPFTPPEERFRRIIITLRPGCPDDGEARIRLANTSGRTLPERGYYTLTPDDPVRYIPNSPSTAITTPGWTVYWLAASGKQYEVTQAPLGGR
ncbi:hypothetical protein [Deinococcus hopiensis]|uniref:Uncharacterized protein n=1 Tax=Deinococcus hopiensis KR-140 TaxID=695939 RepID=A0A1W1UZD3_9DEIO|nr:hypothetical protein [Deinococcus hopiensis]SMB86482.1 hypothetical protein SAMN00790413_03826 [Deinococcus hopiensis KR-140]